MCCSRIRNNALCYGLWMLQFKYTDQMNVNCYLLTYTLTNFACVVHFVYIFKCLEWYVHLMFLISCVRYVLTIQGIYDIPFSNWHVVLSDWHLVYELNSFFSWRVSHCRFELENWWTLHVCYSFCKFYCCCEIVALDIEWFQGITLYLWYYSS